jgi:alcohol dehydrogenase (cytochrome c)/quinohemoprotein ethanol dehydrogenase
MVALDSETGRYIWHYQMTPNESWDFDATQQITLADLEIGGKKHRVAMQANKNGMFYVLDVRTGKLLSATPFVPNINWHSGLDPKSGKPRINPDAVYTEEKGFVVLPYFGGAHSWHPMSFSPITRLMYIPTMYASYPFFAAREDDNPMGQKLSIGMRKATETFGPPQPVVGYLLAWDPVAGKEAWRVPFQEGRGGGTLTTAGNLVFQGNAGEFAAYRADTGAKLWSMPTQTGVVAGPVTYLVDGEQYVSVSVGARAGFPVNYYSPNGSRILVFKLGATGTLPEPSPDVPQVLDPPEQFGSQEMVTKGADTYNRFCGTCHGTDGQSRGMFPDLRYSAMLRSQEAFNAVVLGGALTSNGMVSFKQALGQDDVDSIRAYMVSRAIDLKQHPAPSQLGAPAVSPATTGATGERDGSTAAPAAH